MAFDFLKRIFGNSNGGDLLLPADQFRTLILHECARCDRRAHAFSLIHIDLRNDLKGLEQNGHRLRGLSRAIVRRMRTTDEIGWLDGHSVAVFLPETDMNGARSLAVDTCQDFSYQIYTYPWIGELREDVTEGNSRGRGRNSQDQESRPVADDDEGRQLALRSESPDAKGKEAAAPFAGNSDTARHPTKHIEELILPTRAPVWKRVYDVFSSTVLLIAFSPLFAAVALYIKIVSPGPVFFRQERVGYLGRPFTMIKFRTMRTGSDNISVHKDYLKELIGSEDKAMTKLDNGQDDRLIPLAGILRGSCIDELPQLINVFKGDMSLVGPRPCLDYEAREFALWQRRRFHTVPGMTGLWQVSGKNRLTFKEMMRLDIRYANRNNAAMDLLISFKTVPAIIGQIRDAVKAKYSTGSTQPEVNRAARKWSLQHLIRQLFL